MRAPLAFMFVMAALGCGRSEPPKTAEPEPGPSQPGVDPAEPTQEAQDAHRPSPRRGPDAIRVESEVGGLSQDAVDAAMRSASPALDRCWSQGNARNELVAGTIALVLGVGADGQAAYAYPKQSTLGEAETERCMLKALASRSWPKPVGGKVGVIRTSLTFELPDDVRAPAIWPSTRASDVLSAAAQEIAACKRTKTSSFTATVYVKQIELPAEPVAADAGPDAGDAGEDAPDAASRLVGAPISAGIAVSDEHGVAAAACLERVLMKAEYPAPGDAPAKLTFAL